MQEVNLNTLTINLLSTYRAKKRGDLHFSWCRLWCWSFTIIYWFRPFISWCTLCNILCKIEKYAWYTYQLVAFLISNIVTLLTVVLVKYNCQSLETMIFRWRQLLLLLLLESESVQWDCWRLSTCWWNSKVSK